MTRYWPLVLAPWLAGPIAPPVAVLACGHYSMTVQWDQAKEVRVRLVKLVVRIVILMGISVLVFAAGARDGHAQDRSLNWLRWDTWIAIESDGRLTVTEEYEIAFIGGPFTYGYREISLAQVDGIRNVRVSEDGTPYSASNSQASNTYFTNIEDGDYVITWYYPSSRDQTRRFRIDYEVEGAVLIDSEGDILNWQVVGRDHAFPIAASSVGVSLPDGAFVSREDGPVTRGAGAVVNVSSDGQSVSVAANNIAANEPVELYLRFTHGVIPDAPPRWQEAYVQEARWESSYEPLVNLGLGAFAAGLLLVGSIGVLGLWFTRGRDPKTATVPSYLSEPPSALAPGLVGMLVDERVDLQDIIATLLDLARRGQLRIIEEQRNLLGFSTGLEYRLERLEADETDLSGYERTLLKAVFGGRNSVEMDSLQEKFYAQIPAIAAAMYQDGVRSGLFPKSPERVRGRWLMAGMAGLVLSVGGGFFAGAALMQWASAVLCVFVAGGAVSALMIAAANYMPVKTVAGSLEAAKWRAFREFLRQADRYAELGSLSARFEEYLPYAVAFGLERGWIRRFARIPGTPTPGWYFPYYLGGSPGGVRGRMMGTPGSEGAATPEGVGPSMGLDQMSEGLSGGLERMSDGLVTMLNRASSTFGSAPSSGGFGGSGFSAGGFSGGSFSSGGSGGAGFG